MAKPNKKSGLKTTIGFGAPPETSQPGIPTITGGTLTDPRPDPPEMVAGDNPPSPVTGSGTDLNRQELDASSSPLPANVVRERPDAVKIADSPAQAAPGTTTGDPRDTPAFAYRDLALRCRKASFGHGASRDRELLMEVSEALQELGEFTLEG